jgi:hypothetical protein
MCCLVNPKEDFIERAQALAVKHNLSVNVAALNSFGPVEEDLSRWLLRLFAGRAAGHLMEQGESPSGFYPVLFNEYVRLTQGEFSPTALDFDSKDDWESMIIRFEFGGRSQKILVKEVEDSDWFTPEFVVALNKFAAKHLSGRWVDFYDDSDWCTSLYVPVSAYADFLQLRSSLKA